MAKRPGKIVRSGKPVSASEKKKLNGAEKRRTVAPSHIVKDFHIVGIGASAGGLEAFEQFFSNMPVPSGMAFVLVPHLDPTHKSIMPDLIARHTTMDVVQAKDGMKVAPDKVYIIPPNKDLSIFGGTLQLMDPTAARGLRHPIDFFFRSLATESGEKAVCVILSGTGTEGTLGLKAVKGEGGLVIVQDPSTAKYDGMPQSAIETGLVDFVLPPDKMPEQIVNYIGHTGTSRPERLPAKPSKGDHLQKIFAIIRTHTGHDFSFYKHNTVIRRIERRMAVNQITDMQGYAGYLRDNAHEVDALFKELLIRVTNFFRDAEAFEAIKERAMPHIFRNKSNDSLVRIWVPGCSTGEEAYSLAMIIQEYMTETKDRHKVQIFATDIDSGAIEIARTGEYSESITVDVSPERLARFFVKKGNIYKIKDELRESIVFAVQNIIKDPPFSKLDIISCRNLLIYLSSELQKKIMPLFRYALRPDGVLFLGSSETIGEHSDVFAILDKKWKIFRAKKGDGAYAAPLDLRHLTALDRIPHTEGRPGEKKEFTLGEFAKKYMLENYAPACVVTNDQGEILYVSGRTGNYLEPAEGKASLNVMDMAREGLRLELRTAVRKALSLREDVRLESLKIKFNGGFKTINLDVKYVREPEQLQGLLLMVFNDIPAVKEEPAPKGRSRRETQVDQRISELEMEVKSTKEHLQTTIEELETSNEELKSTNEELQSANEELQSTNEELETSKEELQSVNEELMTVNAELQSKIDELSQASNDMTNLLSSTQIATIFLDNTLRIKRFTPAMKKVINLIETDVGRPISDIVSKIDYPNFVADVDAVLSTLASREKEVRDMSGQWYVARIMPYRTVDNIIEGVVITFIDITRRKTAEERTLHERALLGSVLGYLPGGTDDLRDVRVQLVSKQTDEADLTKAAVDIPVCDQMENCEIFKGDGARKVSEKEFPLTRALKGEAITGEEWSLRQPDGSTIKARCNGGPVRGKDGEIIGGIVVWRCV